MANSPVEDFEDTERQSRKTNEKPPKARFGRRKILAIAVPLLLVAGSLAGAYFSGFADPLLHRLEGNKPSSKNASNGQAGPAFYDMPEMLVNLDSEGRQEHYLKINVSLELASPLDATKVGAQMPVIVDHFQTYLRELRVEDLQGSESLLRIREDLLARVNDAISPVKVKDVLFREILVQ